MDAVFFSPHKMVGGPGSPGVLAIRGDLLRNRVPSVPGGGTVAYVSTTEHQYIEHREHREEGGTPDIVGAIRAGLAFRLKDTVGVNTIMEREHLFTRRAIEHWRRNPGLHLLGNLEADRLSIISFLVRHGEGYLHHEFVVALLNDLFGIQSRSGCSCAGPYGHRLLGIDPVTSKQFEIAILNGAEGLKPGWVRLGFNYFFSDALVDYVLDAVEWVADHGWKLLPHYRFDPVTGHWHHRNAPLRAVASLSDLDYPSGRPSITVRTESAPEAELAEYLKDAGRIAREAGNNGSVPDARTLPPEPALPDAYAHLRWFPLPTEDPGKQQDGVSDGTQIPNVLHPREK